MAKTILVVEDDQNISELLRLYLEKEGYTVNIADDGGKGVELYRRLKPDLVLLDLMLPVLDGWGVLRAIRQDGKTHGQGRDHRQGRRTQAGCGRLYHEAL